MKTTKNFILIVIVVFVVVQGKAQQNYKSAQSQKLQEMNIALDGTYQIQVIDSRELPIMPLTLLPKIDSLRKDNDTVYINVKEHERIMVLPRKVIAAHDFVKPQHLKYLSTQ